MLQVAERSPSGAQERRRTALVTGGAGFLGSHLCERLLASGKGVLCVDNYFTGSRDNILHLLDNPYFEVMRHDITVPLYVEIDEIWNLACPASPVHYQFDPVQTTKVSVHGAINMLGLAKRLKCPILQASTSEVYGDPEMHPQREDYWGNVNPIGPRACYDEGKRCAETLFFDYWRQHDLSIKVARIFNAYGPRMQRNDGRVVSDFIVSALRGAPLTVFGDGSQTRSFCFVDDLISGLMALMDTAPSETGPINIGNPQEVTIRELAEIIVRKTGSSSEIRTAPLPKDDPRRRRPDITLAREKLRWEPRVRLEDGLDRTIAYFESVLRRDAARADVHGGRLEA
jgi:UDP-glucuronate decarboxylase